MNRLIRISQLVCCMLAMQFQLNAQNFLSNGSFESGLTGWNNLVGGGGAATYSLSTTDKFDGTQAMQVVVSKAATNAWDIQSLGGSFPATLNKSYTVSFYAKSVVAGTGLNIVLQNTGYWARSISLTTSWTKYEYEYIAGETAPVFKLQFPSVGTVLIDAINVSNYVPPVINTTDAATVTPGTKYQTMLGFGGALTWFCPRVVKSSKKAEIVNLLFNDLGADIIRFKNWYYPANYPTDKTINNIEGGIYWKEHLTATTELAALAKQANPNVQTLLCSWTPPPYLKSNGKQEQGTLKKSNNVFMYNEFATYWDDVLNNVGFNPDYMSMQNEPGFITPDWGTCEWRPTETADFPGYDKAMDAVYNKIKGRANLPKIIGPETENIGGTPWNSSLNLFREFTTPIKNKSYIHAYAFHPYNYYNSPYNLDKSLLNMIKNEFGDKPNFMTEFSSGSFKWLHTTDAIITMLNEANVSAYIFWTMMWAPNSDAMIEVDDAGNYKVGKQYYAMKHFAKYVDKDYKRISVSNTNTNVKMTGFMNPEGSKVTLVMLNKANVAITTTPSIAGYTITKSQIFQSDGVNFFQNKGALASNGSVSLPDSSITTIVLDVQSNQCTASITASGTTTFCAGGSVVLTANSGTSYVWRNGTTAVGTSATYTAKTGGSYTVIVTNANGCKDTSAITNVTVNAAPIATITSPSNSFCTGENLLLSSSGGTNYIWRNGTTAVGTSSTYTAKTAGSYTVIVTNASGCKDTSAIKTITENPLPILTHNTKTDNTSWTQGQSFTACLGDNVYTGPWPNLAPGWSWTGPNGFISTLRNPLINSITSNQAGKYTATYTDPKGCSASLDLMISVSVPTATITSPATSFCLGGSVTLTANTGASYVWRNGITAVGTSANYIAKTGGSYTVIVTNANGCKDTSVAKVVTVNPVPTINITSPANNATLTTDIFPINTTVTGANISNVTFYNGATLFGTDVTSPFSLNTPVLANGTYTLSAIARNSSNCTDTAKVTVKVNKVVTVIEEESEKNDKLFISPNPFTDHFTLNYKGTFEYVILDPKGMEFGRGTASNAVNIGSELVSGTYFVRVIIDQKSQVFKVVKQ